MDTNDSKTAVVCPAIHQLFSYIDDTSFASTN